MAMVTARRQRQQNHSTCTGDPSLSKWGRLRNPHSLSGSQSGNGSTASFAACISCASRCRCGWHNTWAGHVSACPFGMALLLLAIPGLLPARASKLATSLVRQVVLHDSLHRPLKLLEAPPAVLVLVLAQGAFASALRASDLSSSGTWTSAPPVAHPCRLSKIRLPSP